MEYSQNCADSLQLQLVTKNNCQKIQTKETNELANLNKGTSQHARQASSQPVSCSLSSCPSKRLGCCKQKAAESKTNMVKVPARKSPCHYWLTYTDCLIYTPAGHTRRLREIALWSTQADHTKSTVLHSTRLRSQSHHRSQSTQPAPRLRAHST